MVFMIYKEEKITIIDSDLSIYFKKLPCVDRLLKKTFGCYISFFSTGEIRGFNLMTSCPCKLLKPI